MKIINVKFRLQTLSFIILIFVFSLFAHSSCTPGEKSKNSNDMIYALDNLIAWCIIPFDAEKRGPLERAEMLNELGFTKMAWDWRMEHIEQLPEEIKVLSDHNIELSAVWFWIDKDLDQGMSPHQEQILQTLEDTQTKTTLWVSFPNSFFDDLSPTEKLERAVINIGLLNERAEKIGCKVALYNHMHWFGEPENQVRIIRAVGSENIGIVYNFHHGHHHIDDFSELLEQMKPYLWTINLNGMNPEGPKILDLGKGSSELAMMKTIKESGFDGTIGIIGHTQNEDIRLVLERNLEGMKKLLDEMEEEDALKSYS